MPVQTLKIDLFGISFTIQTDASRNYVESILEHIRARADDVRRTTRVADPLKTSILTSVYLVDELFRERASSPGHASDGEELERIADRLIERLQERLAVLEGEGTEPEPVSP
ncbi:MAG TPA: cell division protein ZapA [Magnetospirillaceae bacterium]|nr:cell division protein ZapA [Magnetospirillaceae bacterium]